MYIANAMPADALATLGASASAGMVLTDPQRWNIPSSASKELRYWNVITSTFGETTVEVRAWMGNYIHVLGPLWLTPFNFNPSMDK